MSSESEVSEFTWQQMIYRDLFDSFFSYLEQINHFLKIGLVEQRQLASLRYWLKCIAQPRFDKRDVFGPYLRVYKFKGVLALMKRHEIEMRPADESSRAYSAA